MLLGLRAFGMNASPTSLVDEILKAINRKSGSSLNRDTLSDIQKDVVEIFDRSLNDRGERWILFDGLEVIGATIQVIDGVVSFKWETRFSPRQRHDNQYGRAQPLGYYDRYDLWVVRYGTIPPVLLARYGEEIQDYYASVPGQELVDSTGDPLEPLLEAYKRAQALGLYGPELPEEPVKTQLPE